MKIFEYIDRINLLNKLIRQKHTGTPRDLARRLNISCSRLYCILDDLKVEGAPIEYSRQINSYYYSIDYEISIDVTFGSLSQNELKVINGGGYLTNFYKYL